ncbi:hypothetical protein [Faecalispora anaeroviscerum]|uniref:hypothetical protein n=1 Tax=Faecalispora anaeroviscerum TaxID=2991836 RepID=UPI0024B9C807|nr:hypothetical protein [Faecalispora anaeroviscerum]
MNKLTKYYVLQILVFFYIVFSSVLLVTAIVSGELRMSLYLIVLILYLIMLILGTKLPIKPPSEEEQLQLMGNQIYHVLSVINSKVPKVLSWAFLIVLVYLFFFGNSSFRI